MTLWRGWTPQKFDSVARTLTTSAISVSLVTAVIVEALVTHRDTLSPLDATLIGWAGTVVGFYLGGHVAQNTAALEEARLHKATGASEAAAVRSEASAAASKESASGKPPGG